MALITVIIPAYNVERYIRETIQSVQNQSFSDFSCIIIDDGSTDTTAQVIYETIHNDERFLLVQQKNGGECAARNTGIALVQTPLLTVLDSDDLWHSEFLQKMTTVLSDQAIDLAWCHFAMFFDHSRQRKMQPWDNIHKTGNPWWDMLMDSIFCMGAWAARTEVVRAAGLFDTSLAIAGDRDFSLRMLAMLCTNGHNKVREIPEELLYYRPRQQSAVRNASLALETEWNIMLPHINHLGVPPRIQKRAWSFLAFKMAVIAAFAKKDYRTALRWYAKALYLDPLNCNLYWLPMRKMLLSLKKAGYVDIPV